MLLVKIGNAMMFAFCRYSFTACKKKTHAKFELNNFVYLLYGIGTQTQKYFSPNTATKKTSKFFIIIIDSHTVPQKFQ